jgi:hypothetical protein
MRVLPPVPAIAREAQEDFIYRELKIFSRRATMKSIE